MSEHTLPTTIYPYEPAPRTTRARSRKSADEKAQTRMSQRLQPASVVGNPVSCASTGRVKASDVAAARRYYVGTD